MILMGQIMNVIVVFLSNCEGCSENKSNWLYILPHKVNMLNVLVSKATDAGNFQFAFWCWAGSVQ